MKGQNLTWNATGLWTLLALLPGVLTGIGLALQRIVLSPPIAAYTMYFYLAVALLPALAVFAICVAQRPKGRRTMLLVLPVFAFVTACCYLALLGPTFYVDVRCQTEAHTGLMVRLVCQCEHATSGGTVQTPCVAEQWRPIPLMRLVKER